MASVLTKRIEILPSSVRLAVELLLIFLISPLIADAYCRIWGIDDAFANSANYTITLNTIGLVVTVVAAAFFVRLRGYDLRELTGLQTAGVLSSSWTLTTVGSIFLVAVFGAVVAWLRPTSDPSIHLELLIRASPVFLGLFIFQVLVLSILVEEFLFRGAIFSVISRQWGEVTGLLVTSTVFGVIHMAGAGDAFRAFAQLTVLGLVLQWLRLRSGGMSAPILGHFLYNLLAVSAVVAALSDAT